MRHFAIIVIIFSFAQEINSQSLGSNFKQQLAKTINDSSDLELTLKAIHWADQNNLPSLKTDGILEIVKFLKSKNLINEATNFLLREIAKSKNKSDLELTYLHDELGRIFLSQGNFPEAQIWFFKSLEERENQQNDTLLAISYRRLGIFYGQQKKDSLAVEFFLKQLESSRKINRERWVLAALTNLGVAYRNLKAPRKSLSYLRQSLKLLGKNEFSIGSFATTFHNIAYTFEELNEIDSSVFYYKKAAEIRKKQGSSRLASSYNNIGYIYNKLENKLDSAEKYLTLSKEIAESANDRLLLRRIYSNLSRTYKEKGNYPKAYDYLFQYDTLNQSIFNETKSRQIEELETKYETEKKQQQIELQEATILIQTAENKTLMTTLLVAVGFTFLTLILFQQRQKALKELRERETDLRIKGQALHEQQVDQMVQEQELKSINAMLEGEEKERKRIAEDLHDRVGSMLSAMKLQTDASDTKMTGLLDETVEEVRRISHNLETQVLNRFGLIAALEDLAQKINSSEKVRFELHHLDLNTRLDNKVEINAYRIVQELVSNALKHSQASEITTQVNRIDNQLIITVEDNGVGFNSLEVKESSSGIGLKNVMSRANELNGNFNIDSGKGNGTTVTVEFAL